MYEAGSSAGTRPQLTNSLTKDTCLLTPSLELSKPAPAFPAADCLRHRRVILALFLPAWFLYFTWTALSVHFAPDDMMNLAGYWRMKPLQLLAAQFLPWRGFYRPMGGLFYVPLFDAFGFNPAPYHAVILALLLANIYFAHQLARRLGCGEAAAALAALVVAYHPGLTNLTYNIAFVYDVLCGFFYLAALTYYVHIRSSGAALTARQVAAFLGLFLCALNSKEMAVTLPPVLLVYEWLYQKRRLFGPAMLAGLVDALYVYGKVFRPDALASEFAYHPVFSWERLVDFQTRAFADLAEKWDYFHGAGVLALWVVILYLAWRRPRPELRFSSVFLAITPLPIEFLPGRAGACLYIPFFGWAIFGASIAIDLAEAGAVFLSGDPVFRHLGRRGCLALLLGAAVFFWARRTEDLHRNYVEPAMAQTGVLTAEVIDQFRAVNPRVRPHSSVVFLNDPFQDWDMAFIAELWFRDRTVDIKLQRKTPLPPDALARADYIFDYRDHHLIRIPNP